ncbi:ATP-dependent endonuclease [Rugamonas sp. CCM 8940]|uniref:ATP-dependent nuclease n=1 Tax=Rugamonas sp. CCM 8940 TaxID=2765359 RepID=UPI0018F68F81|nr:AAA family ATPase [Rugamonas sp. CCM 8940]MBJ7313257.1 AAA family ATPase [Rugamonas sp. CCM 8940]
MNLIANVEVAYFRSIYKFQLSNCSDINIIFGRNDSGKSNVLRALNLFFDNQTNPGQRFRFDRDICHARLAEAQQAEGIRKFVYVKIWFTTPRSWQASLGTTFWVKKQWSVTTQETPQFTSSITDPRLQQYLTRFLNKVRFHYIPAIKDRKIFENLQAEIYNVISSHTEFAESLAGFAQTLGERTAQLSQGLLNGLGIDSVVSTPTDLTDLFRSLDFETKTEGGDAYSLTLQRGDGIQVQHIPQILAFLSDHGAEDYHVWGFEEPENSLELANTIKEAERFQEFSQSSNKQIFLTSHSPAFFSLEGTDVSRYFVSRSEERDGRLTSMVRQIDFGSELPGELMGETPHLPVISAYLREAHVKIEQYEAAHVALAQDIAARTVPIVFVEGESDAIILTKAWEVLIGTPIPVRFESAGGTTKMESLSKDGPVLNRLSHDRHVFALVDNDVEGRSLNTTSKLAPGGRWHIHNSNKVRWCRLPFSPAFSELMNAIQVPANRWPGCLENLFSPEVKMRAEADNSFKLTVTPYADILLPEIFEKVQPYLSQRADSMQYYFLSTDSNFKLPFASWIVRTSDAEPELLEPLRTVLDGIIQLLAAES